MVPFTRFKKMHGLYLEKHEAEIFMKLEKGEKCRPTVTYDYYTHHFNENCINFHLDRPNLDTC